VKPRLRFDKVARRLVADLQEALRDDVPGGSTVVFTCTAPIRLASKTAATLEAEIRALLASHSNELAKTINGNKVRVRILREAHTPNVVGFVHNPDPGAAEALLSLESLQKPR
jgi:hypothetical protein